MKRSLSSYLSLKGIRDARALKGGILKNKARDVLRERQRTGLVADVDVEHLPAPADVPNVGPGAAVDPGELHATDGLQAIEIFRLCLDDLRVDYPAMAGLLCEEWDRLHGGHPGKSLFWIEGKNDGLNVAEAMRRTGLSRDAVVRQYRELRTALLRRFRERRAGHA